MPLWTPARISTALWLDGSDASTLFDATTGGSLVAADGAIARWEDKSGNARHVTQATAANRPLRKTAAVNALDSILFDGTNDDLSGDISIDTSGMSSFTVFKRTNAGGRTEVLLCTGNDTVNGNGLVIIPRWTDNNSYMQTGNIGDRVTVASSIADAAVLLATTGGVNQKARKDGDVYGPNGPPQAPTGLTRTVTYIGSGRGISVFDRYYAGHICETIWLASVASDANTQIVEGYLAWKWGLQSNLPADHTYKSAAPQVPGGGRLINGTSLVRPAGIADHSPLIIGAT